MRLVEPCVSGAKAAADYLGWPVERVYKHIGELPQVKRGNGLLFRRDELDGWVEGHAEARAR